MRRAPLMTALLLSLAVLGQTRPSPPPFVLGGRAVDGTRVSTETMRDRIGVVVFVRGGDERLQQIRQAITGMSGIEAMGVFIGRNRGLAEEAGRKEGLGFPVLFDERNGEEGLAKKLGIMTYPWCVILDPDGRVAGQVGPQELEAALGRQLVLTPPRLVGRAVVAAGNEKLMLAEGKLKTRSYWAAARYVAQLPEDAEKDATIGVRVGAATLALDQAAEGLIAETEKLINGGKLGEAVVKLESLAAALAKSPVLGKVEEQLHSVTDDPELKAKADAQRPAVMAADALEQAMDYDVAVSRAAGYSQLMAVAKRHGTTPAGEQAKALLAKWESDPAERRKLRDALHGDRANGLLSRADNLANSSAREKARPIYEEIVKEYPYTTAAEKAAAALKAWK